MNDSTNSDLPEETRGGLDPPRFSLRRLFVVVGGVAGGIVFFQSVSPILNGFGVFVSAMIGLHVIGNALGTRLRNSAHVPERKR